MNRRILAISDFCITGSGTTPSRQEPQFYENGTIPWVKSGELRESVIVDTEEHITALALEKTSLRLVSEGAILLAMYGATVGRMAKLGVKATTNQAVCHIIPDDTIADRDYLYSYIQYRVPDLLAQAQGGAQPNINQQLVKRLEIPLPPLAEQQRIAAILDQADALRRKRRAALARLDALVQSVFLEMFGDPVTNRKGWDVRPLGSVAEVKGGLQLTSKRDQNPIEVPYLRVANVYRDRLNLTEIKQLKVTQNELDRCSLTKGDILLVEGHGNAEEIGRSAVWDGSITPCVHQNHLIRVQVNAKTFQPVYMSMYLNSDGGRRQLTQAGKTTSGLNTISTSQVRETNVLMPPLELQNTFVAQIEKIHRLVEKHQQSYKYFDNLFHALQQRAFRGDL